MPQASKGVSRWHTRSATRRAAEHVEILGYVQIVQALAEVWRHSDPSRRLPPVWDVIFSSPRSHSEEDRVLLAVLLRRIAEEFCSSTSTRPVAIGDRLQRRHSDELHVVRALKLIQREFGKAELSLTSVAAECGVSAPYLSHLLTARTRHHFRTHLKGTRLLQASHLLFSSTYSIKGVADRCGFRSTSAFNHAFREVFEMTPGEFRRWTLD